MMIDAYLRWNETASAGERASAASALATAYATGTMTPSGRRAAETALTVLLDDPSPKVRLAIAEALGSSVTAPRAVIHALSRDQTEIAGHVIAFSPVLSDAELVDIVAEGRPAIQRIVAMRPTLSRALCAALAEVGAASAVCDMLENPAARLTSAALSRIVERFGSEAGVRSLLLERPDLPAALRHRLVVMLGEALSGSALLRNAIGETRIGRVTGEACREATLVIAGESHPEETEDLVHDLIDRGHMSEGVLMRMLCRGQFDVFAASVSALSGRPLRHVRAVLADRQRAASAALLRAAGIGPSAVAIFVSALALWREAGRSSRAVTIAQLADRLVACHGHAAETDEVTAELLMLVDRLDMAERRAFARMEADAAAVRAA